MYERSYHAKVLKQNTPPEKKRRKFISIRRLLLVGALVVFVGGVIVLIRLPGLQVREIEVVGTNVVDPEDVSVYVRSQIQGKYFYFLPRASMLLVPTTTIAKRATVEFPRFASVDVRRSGVKDLIVTVKEHAGVYLWCTEVEHCYFMTKQGVVYAEAPVFSGDAYRKIYIGSESILPFIPVEEKVLGMISLLEERLPLLGIHPVEFRAISERQWSIAFNRGGSVAQLLIDPSADVEKTIEDLATGLATEPLKTKFDDESMVLRYLDARFANKVIYKFE